MEFSHTFNEICKVSAIKATTALSKFLNIPLGLNMKMVETNKIGDIDIIKDSDDETVNLYLPITGNLSGASFFIYSKPSALSLCDVLFHRPEGTTLNFSEVEISALVEVTNIVIGHFLSSFAQSLQMDFLMHHSASFDCSIFQKTFAQNLSNLADSQEKAVVKISFGFQHVNIQGYVLIFFDEAKISPMLKQIASTANY